MNEKWKMASEGALTRWLLRPAAILAWGGALFVGAPFFGSWAGAAMPRQGCGGDLYQMGPPSRDVRKDIESVGMAFVWVLGGCFAMGSDVGDDDEKPVHEVCVDSFWMGKYEVTLAQWKRVMSDHFPDQPGRLLPTGRGDHFPVDSASWDDAQDFLEKLNKRAGKNGRFRLPTEAEWEFACRSGGKSEVFSGGDDPARWAWYDRTSRHDGPKKAGTKNANGLGLYDMSGNVLEWVLDDYESTSYEATRLKNPIHRSGRFWKVVRGGAWNLGARFAKCSGRDAVPQTAMGTLIGLKAAPLGFRVVSIP